jgi:hypothetical protein
MSNAFSKMLRLTAKNLASQSLDASNWFKDQVDDIQKGKTPPPRDPNNIFKKFSMPQIGGMYLYLYDPKTKDTLPFWDMYPLVLPVEMYVDGFLGINLHYLPPLARVNLLGALVDITDANKYNETKRLNISYELLSRYSNQLKGANGCLKRYLFAQVRSSFHNVDPLDWQKAALLPLQRWKINPSKTYASSPPY